VAGPLEHEALELVRSARALLEELAEEGVEEIPRAPAPPARAASPGPGARGGDAALATPAARPSTLALGRAPAAAQTSLLETTLARGRPTLEQVRETLGECTRCRLCEGRTQIVFGHGSADAELLFVGEGPGEQEDLQGLPFVGRAGELLTRMIERGLGIPRSSVYICNIVKCRPPGNRTPLADEVAACRPFLDGQIDAVAPKVIVALGKPAASLLLGRDIAITKVRGVWHEYRGIPVMPTFHPAFVLRQYTETVRRQVWEDLKAALERARRG
jgi:DNA polymerase